MIYRVAEFKIAKYVESWAKKKLVASDDVDEQEWVACVGMM